MGSEGTFWVPEGVGQPVPRGVTSVSVSVLHGRTSTSLQSPDLRETLVMTTMTATLSNSWLTFSLQCHLSGSVCSGLALREGTDVRPIETDSMTRRGTGSKNRHLIPLLY